MYMILKEALSIPVISSIILALFAAISKKYAHYSRRDFFSRPPSEQIKAIEWLRQANKSPQDPLSHAEQQFRLQSFGLHRNWAISCKIIAFYSSNPQDYIPALKALLRWPGLYTVMDGKIYPHKHQQWFLPLIMMYIFGIVGTEVFKSYLHENVVQFIFSLIIVIILSIIWCALAFSAVQIWFISKKLNCFNFSNDNSGVCSEDFSSILNNNYP
ncbi:hypothetical protein G9X50_02260 [Cronobacter sakazakii]|uniref:hypothetical protein n=1 Tax=Cronobacter sakazakii TaxID=28141 RepID=UPI0014121118|nr:hypothetical protein [Cronobacter sakazakii]ELQ6207412.1 hypothetical protein [Cronobacter sakazakii]ELY6375733.1 hypothetical protein [Cronobacter sakazakii]ELZ3956251.1 hypothetical protein [Cronobacter sakazakii]NHV12409.1 hypothetical protein [Cronobacter sakazakii]